MSDTLGVRQAGARRSREAVLTAAAAAFVEQGVQAPVRDIAGRAGVGVGTVYRHFPTRADLVSAVYRHQVDDCTALAVQLRQQPIPAVDALDRWVAAFVDFLVTKHGLSVALGSEDPSLANLHALILDELVPACATLLTASQEAGETDQQITAYTLLRAIGNLCILGPDYDRNDARQMVARLLAGCRTRGSTISGPDAARSAQRPRSARQSAV
ncbi:TetR/AcrR family transcriptional regulator [Actinoplanes utahensis]|uniref:TetR/AcrR family transcriptional regulator n=1 Tax=Actinoplanes utahensis TaxID=1869 RepID=UPI0007C64B0A|nr:TetR/AcrR family transcriptional regulator [Actinoplanes utahensis]GIF33963.1 TetR family transcriptional regulator [Actinoplanes utahensis]